MELTKSPDYDCADVSVLQQLDRAAMELEVAQYRVQLIHGDLKLESGIQFGNGLHKAPLEDELEALEEQLENTLSAKQVAEDRLKALTAGRRTVSNKPNDRRTKEQQSHPVDITRANISYITDTQSLSAGSTPKRDIANTKCIRRA